MNSDKQYETPVLRELGDILEVTEAVALGGTEDGTMKGPSVPILP